MRKLLLVSLILPFSLYCQQKQPVSSLQEDCGVEFNFTAQSSGVNASGTTTAGSTGTTAYIDNRTAGCLDWLVTYSTTTGVTGLSLLFQTATNAAGSPGTASAYGGTLTSGINPNTAATPPWAITDATGNKYPFLRMNLTSLTGAGNVQGKLYGWKRRPSYVSAVIPPGTICTAAAPCPVDGPTAAGSPPTFPPVMVAGQDGAPGNIRTILTDSVGRQIEVGAAASGAAKAGNPVQVGAVFNTTQPTVTTGQAVEAQSTARGALIVAPGVDPFSVTACPSGTPCVVVGPAADGAAVSGNPVRIGGKDGSGNTQDILTDTTGTPAMLRSSTWADGQNVAIAGLFINETGGVRGPQVFPNVFNGGTTTGTDRMYSASLANDPVSTTLTARNSKGSILTEKGSRWTVVSNPAASSQATASIASEASVRHVVDCISFSASAGGAVTAANVNVNIRDGATGAGTIIWTFQLSTPTAAALGLQEVTPHSICGLNLVGTTATAMTAEFSAGVTNLIESVSFSGYNVN